jgi:hypothetical protein
MIIQILVTAVVDDTVDDDGPQDLVMDVKDAILDIAGVKSAEILP